jgi:hypothetical protein
MALTATTLATAIPDAHTLVFGVTSATGATVGGFCRVDNEYSFVSEVLTTTTPAQIRVRTRGDYGGVARAHDALAPVVFGLVTDLHTVYIKPEPAEGTAMLTVSADGAIPQPTKDTIVLVAKPTASALTLANPSLALNGTRLTIITTTAQAHVVTFATGVHGTAGSDVATSAAAVGATLPLVAQGGVWRVDAPISGATPAPWVIA